MSHTPLDVLNVGVKDMVEYVYATGDLAAQRSGQSAHTGQQCHTAWQARYGLNDLKEVPIDGLIAYHDQVVRLVGRIDGVLKEHDGIIIEEIKSTHLAVGTFSKPIKDSHLRQAQVYAYLYALKHELATVKVRLTYVHYPSYETTQLNYAYDVAFLEHEVRLALETYRAWMKRIVDHHLEREHSLEGLSFPFETMRESQSILVEKTYQTMIEEDILYAFAPTGTGKTMATLFATLKTMHKKEDKLFYATAKNAQRQVALEMVQKLKDHGLKAKAIALHSKDRLCLRSEVDCDPAVCPFARNYYDRVNDALKDVFEYDGIYDAAMIKDFGALHSICPHELSLDVARFCDIIVGDFNYAFDPRIQLVRFFEEETYRMKVLVDEAHNLIDRSRSMYSASLSLSNIDYLKTYLVDIEPSPHKALRTLYGELEHMRQNAARNQRPLVAFETVDEPLLEAVDEALDALSILMDQHKHHRLRKIFREGYFELIQFKLVHHYYGLSHAFCVHFEPDDVRFEIKCLDASKALKETLTHAVKGAVLFSATLSPMDYYQQLITQGVGKSLVLPSPFDPKRLGLHFDISTSQRYKDRDQGLPRVLDSIVALCETKAAPYILYAPSFAYLKKLKEQLPLPNVSFHWHEPQRSPEEKDALLERFKSDPSPAKILMTVLGGSFGEGIDLAGDALVGVMIIGLALPAFSDEQQLLRYYYDQQGFSGFDYAYTYPGMARIIQAVGRVIRSETDTGVAVLIDDRYQQPPIQSLFPAHWTQRYWLEEDDYLQGYLKAFWQRYEGGL